MKMHSSEEYVITEPTHQFLRYWINGLVATSIHYSLLSANMVMFKFESAGAANLVASFFGITASYVGNCYFVFRKKCTIMGQAVKFIWLFAVLAVMNGFVLYIWSDKIGLGYNSGFIIAVTLQLILGFYASRHVVFK